MRKFIDKSLLFIDTENGKLKLFSLAIPIFFDAISLHFIGLIQTMMASRYLGGFFVTPISVSNSLLSILQQIVALACTGLSILLSIQLGKKRHDNCKKIIGTALFMVVGLSFLVALIGIIFAKPLLTVIGLNKAEYVRYMPYAMRYFRYRAIAIVITMLSSMFLSALRCYGHTGVGLIASISSNGVNAAATAVGMFLIKTPQAYAPEMLAITSTLAAFISLFIALSVFIKKKIPFSLHFSTKWLKRIFVIGTPASLSILFYTLSQAITTSICLRLTEAAFLAKNYLAQVIVLVGLFGYGIGQAHAIMVGRLCGMEDLEQADKMHKQNLRIVILLNTCISLFMLLIGTPLIKLIFNANDDILAYTTLVFLIDVFVEIGRGMNHVGQNALNATSDVNFTTAIAILSCWGCSVGGAYLFGIVFNWGLYGIWIASALDELFRGFMYFLRWKKGNWKQRFTN